MVCWTLIKVNPGFLEGSLTPPFKFQEELIYYQYNFIQLLSNLFRVCWKWKMLTSSVTLLTSLQQINNKKSKKSMKITNIYIEIVHIFWTTWENSIKSFRKDVT